MARLMAIAVVVGAALGLNCAVATDRVWHTYREVSQMLGLTKFFEIPLAQRDSLRLLFKREAGKQSPQTLVLTIKAKPRDIVISPDDSGSLAFPFDTRLVDENPDVLINLPAGERLSLDIDLRPVTPRQLATDYQRLMACIPQVNALIRKQAGMMRFFAPTIRKLVLQYARPQGQTVIIKDAAGATTLPVNSLAQIVIPFDQTLYERNVAVLISAPPDDADFLP